MRLLDRKFFVTLSYICIKKIEWMDFEIMINFLNKIIEMF